VAPVRALLAGLAAAASLAAAGPAYGAEEVLTTAPGAIGLSAYGGVAVWSEPEPGPMWRLRGWWDGAAHDVALPPRRVPYDADVGPDREGRPVAVFSRCRREPALWSSHMVDWTTARGCDVWQMELRSGRMRPVRAAATRRHDESVPAIWRGSLVFQRRGARATVSRWMLSSPPGDPPHRLPVGSGRKRTPGADPGMTLLDTDLGPQAATMLWLSPWSYGITTSSWEVVVALRSGGSARILDRGGYGECSSRLISNPSVWGRGALWMAGGYSCGEEPIGRLLHFDLPSRRAAQATTTGLPLEASRDGATIWWLRGSAYADAAGEPLHPQTCDRSGTPCELVRSSSVTFVPTPFRTPEPDPF